jgi:heme exporter protein C
VTTTSLSEPGATGSASVPRRHGVTATPFTFSLGVLVLFGFGWVLALGLIVSPEDVVQGDSVRIMYIHVPTVWVAYLAFAVTAFSSGMYLFRRVHSLAWDRVAGASAEVGVLFMALTLVTGSLWGRLTWGVYWEWDARLTSTAFMFVTYVGYLAVRRLGGSPHARARRSAVLGLLAVLLIPLVHFSVELWRSLHQEASIANPSGDVTVEDMMLVTLMIGLVTFTLLYVWLVMHRQRTMYLEDRFEDADLDVALAARRAEAEG